MGKAWFFIFLFMSSWASAQRIELRNFDVFSDGQQVQVKWTIEKGSLCNGTKIFRSADGVDFQEIGFIDGICGSSSEAVGYEFRDTLPIINKISYYKLRLGVAQFTNAKQVFFMDASVPYTVFPNPATDVVHILFHDKGQPHDFQLFDLSGRCLVLWENRAGNEIVLHRGGLPSGLYLFSLRSKDGTATAGKFIFF